MKLVRLIFAGLLLGPLLAQPVAAQALDPTFVSPTSLYKQGTVYGLGPQQTDGKRVVLGSFSRVNGTAVSNLARLDAAGSLDQAFSQHVGAVSNAFDILGLPAGQYLLGAEGGTIVAGGLSRTELLRLNADGTGDATFDAGTGPTATTGYGFGNAYAVQTDGKILVAGRFDTYSGMAAAGVVRLLANGSRDATFTVSTGISSATWSAGNTINALTVQADGKILVGGTFTSFNGQTTPSLVRLTANGSLDPTFTAALQANTTVNELLVQPDGSILVAGYVRPTGSSTATGLTRLLPTGAVDASFLAANYVNNSFSEVQGNPSLQLQADGKILIAGYPGLNNTGALAVARLTTNGAVDASFTPTIGPDAAPSCIGLQADGSLLAGGYFNYFNQLETPLGRFTSTGAADASFTPKLQVPGRVLTVVSQADGQLLVGGDFSELNGQPAHRLARFSTTGALDASFSAATGLIPSSVNHLLVQPDGKILAGASDVRRFLASGAPDPTFPAYRSTGSVTALALQADGRILVGSFILSSTYRYLLRLTSTGAYDATFVRPVTNTTGLGVPGVVNALLVQPDGRIVVAEDFTVSGTPSTTYSRVVRYESTGALDASFANSSVFGTATTTSASDHAVLALAQQADGKLLVGGEFGSVSGTAQTGVARLTTTGTLDASFAPGSLLSGVVFTLAIQPNGRVLLGGSFTAGTLTNLARVLTTGQLDASFANTATPNGSVSALALPATGGIALAGAFSTVGSQPALVVARIMAPNVLSVAAPAAVADRTTAWPVPAHSALHVAPDLSAQPLTAELLDALGRTVRQQAVTGAAEFTLPVSDLPAGMYLLRVNYAAGTVTRRVAVE